MKLKFKIISIIIAFILIVGLILVFSDLKESEDELETSLDQLQDEPTTLFWSEVDFNEIHLTNEGENSEIILVKNEQGNWDTAEPLEEKVNLNKLDQAVSIIFSLSGNSKEVKLSVDDTFTEEKERSITLINQSGIKEKLTIGKKSDDGTFYYVTLLDSEEIYQVAADLVDALPTGPEDLFDRSIIQITSEQVSKIKIYNGIQTIELAPSSPYSEEEVRTNLSGWYMHEPYSNVYSVKYNPMSEMIYGIKNIEWIEIIDESDSDLEEYGLTDVNFEITFSSDSEEETILIGAPATNHSYYAKLANDDKIFTIDNRALQPYSYQAFDLVEKFMKIIALDVLKQLEIQTEDKNYIIAVDQIDAENDSEINAIFKINDQQIEDEVFRDLYVEIVGLSVDQEVDNATYHTPEITMSYTILDSNIGEKEILVELVDYDEDNYAVFLEGQADFLVKKADFSQVIKSTDEHIE